VQAAASNPSEFDAIAALKVRLAVLSDPVDSSTGSSGPRTEWHQPKPKYRHTPTVVSAQALYRIDGEYAPLRNVGGITKWIADRDIALKARRAESLNAAEMRRLEAEAKAEKRLEDRAYRADLAKRKAEAGGNPIPKPQPLPDYISKKLEGKQTALNMLAYGRGKVARRMHMFEHRAGIVAGRDYAPFVEKFTVTLEDGTTEETGLRSRNGSLSTALFLSRLPAHHRLAYGNDKERLIRSDMSVRKIFILDMPYVELDRTRLAVLVVDLDTNWASEDALRAALLEILGPMRMPNLIAYRWSEDGTEIESPHLLWLLPPGSEVGTGGKSRQAPIHAFNKVQRALVSLLIPLGADIGHHNPKVKNPLSPYWSILIDDSAFLDLTQWKAFLPGNVSEDEMRRRAAIHQVTEDGDLNESNRAWNTVITLIRAAIKKAVAEKSPAYAAAMAHQASFYDWLLSAIKADAIALLGDEAVIHRILRKQCAWRAEHRKLPNPLSNRGRDRLLNQMEGANQIEKQANAGSRTRKGQRKTSVALVADAIRQAKARGLPTTGEKAMAGIIKDIKTVSRATAYRVYKQALKVVSDAVGYIAILTPTSVTTPQLPVPQVTRAPATRIRWHRRPVIRDRQPVALPSRSRFNVPHRVPPACGHPATRQNLDPVPSGHPATRSNPMPTSNATAEHRTTVLGLRSPGITLH
jgi:hypothetical protein